MNFISSAKIDNLFSTFFILKTFTSPNYAYKDHKYIDLICFI